MKDYFLPLIATLLASGSLSGWYFINTRQATRPHNGPDLLDSVALIWIVLGAIFLGIPFFLIGALGFPIWAPLYLLALSPRAREWWALYRVRRDRSDPRSDSSIHDKNVYLLYEDNRLGRS